MASLANQVAALDRLLGLWRLNETSGTVAEDRTANANDGTYTGTPSLGQAGAQADGDLAVGCNGSSQYVTMGNQSELRPTAAVTLIALFRPGNVSAANAYIAGCGTTADGYSLRHATSTLYFTVNGQSASWDGLVNDQWYLAVGTFDGTTIRLYVNGILRNSYVFGGPTTIAYGAVTDFVLAQAHGVPAARYFQGSLDEVSVLGQAVPAAVITRLQDGRASKGFETRAFVELNGVGNGWTDVSEDLVDNIEVQWGMPGAGIADRVAVTGTFSYWLDNSANNKAGIAGYYSPRRSVALTGFLDGIRTKLVAGYGGGFTKVLHIGTIDTVTPLPGTLEGTPYVKITAVDYIDDLARANITNVPAQLSQRSDQIFSTLIATMTRQPEAIEAETGIDTYPIALDNVQDEKAKLLEVIRDLVLSELGYCYVKGGTLVFESRARRPTLSANVDTFLDTTHTGVELSHARGLAINQVQVTAHPRGQDAAATTQLYALQSVMQVAGGSSITILGPYRDPANPTARVGGRDMVTPVAVTDYRANAAADGTGDDLTTNISVSAAFGGNGVRLTITNLAGRIAYIGGEQANTYLRCRGRGIYDYGATVLEAEDEPSQLQHGTNTFSLDQKYQSDPRVASEAAYYLVNLYKDPLTQAQSVSFFCPRTDDALAARLLNRDISDRIGVQETATGLSGTTGFFINAVTITIESTGHLFVTFLLAPADNNRYWLLEVVGSSELDATTRLGFGLILGHTDIAHGDGHTDSAHSDVAHSDTAHTDVAHADAAHGDAAFADVAHNDVAHNDVAHTDWHVDITHSDSHSDTAHTDTAHSDTAHSDTAHEDTAHLDYFVDHDDGGHSDYHEDSPHADTAHTDVAHSDSHSDVAHADSHSDVAHHDTHGDVAHTDVAHTDVAHTDVAHSDGGHQDTGHADVTHVDVAHSDVEHGDNHADSAHGDIN